jgi:hypothetical protein
MASAVWRVIAGPIVAAAVVIWCSTFLAASLDDKLETEGPWTYTQRSDRNLTEYLATTPSSQDVDTWLLITCSTDERLIVAVMHVTKFRFPLAPSAPITLRAAGLPGLSVGSKSIEAKTVVLDPSMMRHVVRHLIEREQFDIVITGQGGETHEYTFLMQPNDRALAPLRSLCLSVEKRNI